LGCEHHAGRHRLQRVPRRKQTQRRDPLAATSYADDATISKSNPTVSCGTIGTLSIDADGSIQDFLLNFAVPTTPNSPTSATCHLPTIRMQVADS